ncbi:MAG TPA: hypothetical protein VFF98_06690 [Novosphingobium sp.]|nr:hypothetical protein [Novosphingobium sp.]
MLYRYVGAQRAGKWYPDLATAQRFACKIGAGFLAEKSGQFCAYLGTRLEVLLPDGRVIRRRMRAPQPAGHFPPGHFPAK